MNDNKAENPIKNDGNYIYGNKLKHSFLLNENIINFNHGSFGAVPKEVMEEHMKLLIEQETYPEIWFRKTIYNYNTRSRDIISKLINCNVNDVVLVENASSAINSILRSYKFQVNDKVVVFSTIYKMCSDTISRLLTNLTNVTVLEIPIKYPLENEDQLIDSFINFLDNYNNDNGIIRMAIFSHISSMPSIIEPIEKLTKIAKSKGIEKVVIDGAHAPGVISIDVKAIGADYYTGNLHKWVFCPKGSAFLWCNPSVVTNFHPQPTVISSTGEYSFIGRYNYTGTRDYTPYYALPVAIEFIEKKLGGFELMQNYNRKLLKDGSNLLISEWNTSYLVSDKMTCFMSSIILPKVKNHDDCVLLQKKLFDENNISMIFGSVSDDDNNKIFFTRISVQVYLEMNDFILLAKNVKRILEIN